MKIRWEDMRWTSQTKQHHFVRCRNAVPAEPMAEALMALMGYLPEKTSLFRGKLSGYSNCFPVELLVSVMIAQAMNQPQSVYI